MSMGIIDHWNKRGLCESDTHRREGDDAYTLISMQRKLIRGPKEVVGSACH